jgi:hypothetical protein
MALNVCPAKATSSSRCRIAVLALVVTTGLAVTGPDDILSGPLSWHTGLPLACALSSLALAA